MSTSTLTDSDSTTVAELVLTAQTGDRTAFGELFQRFERHVFSIAFRRMGNYAEAQELVQDVFIQAMEKLDQLRQPECFGGWLRMITTRMAINRSMRRGPVTSAEPEMMAATCVEETTPLSLVLTGERESQVRAGLNRLRDLDRQTLVAFYVDGRSLIEMSDDFDAPIGTIKRRLHVARKRLAEEVEEFAEAGCGV